MNKNIYEINLEKIEKYIKQKKYELALEIIDEELNMPYTPKEYLDHFINFKKSVLYEINLSKNSRPISKDEILDMIETNDRNKIIEAINLLSTIKINNDDLVILNPVLESSIPRIFKCLLLENLIENKINLTINYSGKPLNPSSISSFRDSHIFKKSIQIIQELTIKEPFLQNVSFDLLIYYFMYSFPFDINNDAELISNSCLNYAKKMHGLSDFAPNKITNAIDFIISELQQS